MANGRPSLIENFDNLANPNEVPTADLGSQPSFLHIPIARLAPNVDMEQISITEFVQYLNGVLAFNRKFVEAQTQRSTIANELAEERRERQAVSRLLVTTQQALEALTQRVFNLEHATPSGNPQVTGMLAYGLLEADGLTPIGDAQTVMFEGVPSSTRVHLPAATADNQRWYLQYPAGVIVSHIFNEGPPRVDELGENPPLWSLDTPNRRYSSQPLTAGFGGTYSIVVAMPPSGG